MITQTEIELQITHDADTAMLLTFFEQTGNDKVKRRSIASRGDTSIVQVILTIVGTWAVERYVLDPFADKLREWTDAAKSLNGKQFRISVRFQEGHLLSIETFRISNPLIVRNIWQTIKSASDLLASHTEEIPLDRVLIVPDKLEQPLVIAYQGTRPTHLLDLSTRTMTPIEVQDGPSTDDMEQFVPYLETLRASQGHAKE